jgi:hypothetical protein
MARKRQLGPPEPPGLPGGTPLRSIPEFPPERLRDLETVWITTAEEFLSMAATPQGQEGLSSLLNVGRTELESLVYLVRGHLPDASAQSFSQESSHQFPLGAVFHEGETPH